MASWFGRQFSGMQEPALVGCLPSDLPVYRFTFLPSFGHPVTVRVHLHEDGTATVITHVGGGLGGYAPNGILAEHSAEISVDKVIAMNAAIASSGFTSLPALSNKRSGMDGSEWVFEGATGGHYRVVARWEGADIRPLGLYFLQQLGQPGPEAKLPASLK